MIVLQACILVGTATCLFIVNKRYPSAISRALTLYALAHVMVAVGGVTSVFLEPLLLLPGQIAGLGVSAVGTCLYYFAFRSLQERDLHLRAMGALYLLTLAAVLYFSLARRDAGMSLAAVCLLGIVLNSLVTHDLFRNFHGHGRGHVLMGVNMAIYVAALTAWTVALFLQPQQAVLIDSTSEASSYMTGMLCITAAMGPVLFLLMCNDEFNTYLQSMASTDPLTGVANRRRLAQRAAEEISRARRSNQAVTLAMIDLDHFKNLNDTHGHEAGDRALCAVAATCVEALRGVDLVSRTGGEEFVVLMPETTLERGIEVAERLRHAISQIALPVSGGCLTLSASFGVATLRPGETSIDEMLKRADQALYRSKANGRNRVSSQEPAMAARTSLEGGAAAAS